MRVQKYISLILFSVIIVLSIGTFYGKASMQGVNLPHLTLNKVSGEDAAIEPIILTGDMMYSIFSSESFRVDTEGTSFLRDENYFNRLKGYYKPVQIERLQQEYRNFMRGKGEYSESFYEDEHSLAYGSIEYDLRSFDQAKFEVALLDKKTNKTTSFTVPIPNRADYWYLDQLGIQLVDNNVIIFTSNESTIDEVVETYMYTFDMEKEELKESKVIASLPLQESMLGHTISDLLVDEASGGEHIIASRVEIDYIEPENAEIDTYTEFVKEIDLIKYNLKTGESTEIDIPDGEKLGVPLMLVGETLYFGNIDKNNLVLSSYHLAGEKVTNSLSIDYENTNIYLDILYNAAYQDGKVYFIPSNIELGQPSPIFAVNLETMETVYKGELDLDRPIESMDEFFIYLDPIEFKQ